jgi:type II restriction/modification system DNA methylase subunit YeeA
MIYEEQGYNPIEIPSLILKNNLFGIDIDPRAAQMASFVLMMKSRQKQRRFFNTVATNKLQPNIYFYQDFDFDNKFKNATALGSLVTVEPHERDSIKVESNSLFGGRQQQLSELYQLLGQRYDVVVTNPPYINSSRLEGSVKQFIEEKYPEAKTDLFSVFILRCLELCNEEGLTGYMTPFVWMFISSYEKLREELIEKHFINNLIQLEYSGFDGATVPICTFTLRNKYIKDGKGSFVRLSDFRGAASQAPKTLEAIQNTNCGWFYTTNQKDFEKIPGSPIGYWLSKNIVKTFEAQSLGHSMEIKQGLATGNNDNFLKLWQEVSFNKIGFGLSKNEEFFTSDKRWAPYNKGGAFRRWYGNRDFLIQFNYKNFEKLSKVGNHLPSRQYYFKESITWSDLTSGSFSARFSPTGSVFDVKGSSGFSENPFKILGFLNSKLTNTLLQVLNPTLSFQVGNIKSLPYKIPNQTVENIVIQMIEVSKDDWDSKETSWDFTRNELLKHKSQDLEETFDLFKQFWENKFFQLHKNEEELNRKFIEIYALQNDLTPDVPLDDITILKQETSIENGNLVFNANEVFVQFMSYAVGCMFGRYSLDKEGLILANQGETLEDYNITKSDTIQESKKLAINEANEIYNRSLNKN